MELGPQSEQAALTRMILTHAMKMITGETSTQFDEMRATLEQTFSSMRYKDELDNGSGLGPSFVDVEYSDEGFDD